MHAQEEHRLPARLIKLALTDDIVTEVLSGTDGRPVSLVALEPVVISGVRAGTKQLREWIPLDHVPPVLIQALLAIEDRRFFLILELTRSLSDERCGPISLGGSCTGWQYTDPAIGKNLFYSPKRTIWRKFKELVASLALEFKYRKQDILESYVNEIYLGQAGPVSIYGVGRRPPVLRQTTRPIVDRGNCADRWIDQRSQYLFTGEKH